MPLIKLYLTNSCKYAFIFRCPWIACSAAGDSPLEYRIE